MHISSYDDEPKALNEPIEAIITEPFVERIKAEAKKFTDQAYTDLYDSIETWLQSNLQDNIRSVAARQAERIILSALEGDDDELKNLFGLSYRSERDANWKITGSGPTGWALVELLVNRFPDLLRNERVRHLEEMVAEYKKVVVRLEKRLEEKGW